MPAQDSQVLINASLWEGGAYVSDYANRVLAPVEAVILARYREQITGRVLDVGCGAGRILGYLCQLGGQVHGFDLSAAMVGYCRKAYPDANVWVGDLGALGDTVQGSFDCVLAACNVLDVFDDHSRRRVLKELREHIAPGGLLVFSSHNLAHLDAQDGTRPSLRRITQLAKHLNRPPGALTRAARRVPGRIRNRRRLAALQARGADYAIINDAAHDYGMLLYYIRCEDQQRQLAEVGFEVLECLDAEGGGVKPGEAGHGPWLHYVARPR